MGNYFSEIKSKKNAPVLIAGPCSAESEEQVAHSIETLDAQKVDLIRFGVWKPRTRPNSFEGIGSKALEWIYSAKLKNNNAKVCIEVASANHVELALKNNIDVVWIGARTTVNPFTVQELADSLKGTGLPVMVKNPVNPDLKLWIGAIERIRAAGITSVAAVHRGFSTYHPVKYRNIPEWQIPIALQQEIPDIPMFCDPSHIAGKRDLVLEVSQKALDLSFDGLMIEVHPNPDKALSDPKQQIKLVEFRDFLSELVYRESHFKDSKIIDDLVSLREQIDSIDQEIIDLLAQRIKQIRKIGSYKKENNVAVYQSERWKEIISSRTSWGHDKEISDDFVLQLYQLIHDESIRIQTDLMK